MVNPEEIQEGEGRMLVPDGEVCIKGDDNSEMVGASSHTQESAKFLNFGCCLLVLKS